MGRKPKNPSHSDSAIDEEGTAHPEDGATAPIRRGRKPKLTAIPPKVTVAPSGDNAAVNAIAAGGRAADIEAPPARRRPGPKPRQRVEMAETAPLRTASVKPGRRARAPMPPASDTAPASSHQTIPALVSSPTSASDSVSGALLPGRGQAAGQDATRSIASESADLAQPAAQWDRATDAVRFDWTAIQQTASREGPNQVLAKLLVAARAEGANSRWPL